MSDALVGKAFMNAGFKFGGIGAFIQGLFFWVGYYEWLQKTIKSNRQTSIIFVICLIFILFVREYVILLVEHHAEEEGRQDARNNNMKEF